MPIVHIFMFIFLQKFILLIFLWFRDILSDDIFYTRYYVERYFLHAILCRAILCRAIFLRSDILSAILCRAILLRRYYIVQSFFIVLYCNSVSFINCSWCNKSFALNTSFLFSLLQEFCLINILCTERLQQILFFYCS